MTEQTPSDTARTPSTDYGRTPAAHPGGPEHTQPVPSTHRFPGGGAAGSAQGFGQPSGYDTTPYGAPTGPGWGPPQGPGPSNGQGASPRGRRTGAGVLVAALLLGTAGGVGGAAAVNGLDALQGTGESASQSTRVSTIASREDTPPVEGSVEDVANSVLPSVVKITVVSGQGSGSGSGVVLSSDGEILTNEHVVSIAENGGRVSVSFDDGTTAAAEVVGTDPLTDLAVIRAQGVSDLTPATLGRSDILDVGEEVIAIGSPYGLEATVTSGIVSALNRPVSVGRDSSSAMDTTYPAVQTDAAINPGNSGGPLVNMAGEVVGINSSIRTASQGGSIGLGFAIPVDKVLPIVEQLRAGETPTHARLGVTVADASSSDGLLTGAGINSIAPGSAAAKAGLERGDVVTRIDDELVVSSESLVATIRGYRPGDTVTLTVVRDGETRTVEVTLDSDEGTQVP